MAKLEKPVSNSLSRIKAEDWEVLRTEALASRGLAGSPKYIPKHSLIIEVGEETSSDDDDSIVESISKFPRSNSIIVNERERRASLNQSRIVKTSKR